jgi:DNA-binding SARP family transcriptional activator
MRSLFLRCLAHQMMHCKAHGDWEQALSCGECILKVDPLREEIHRELMHIYVVAGRRPLTIRQYEICRAALQAELGITPMPETRQLHNQILTAGEPGIQSDLRIILNGIATALDNPEDTRHEILNLYNMIEHMNTDS